MERLAWVCLAGALGAGSRYLIGLWIGQRLSTVFPFGTLVVNIVGCFFIAFVMHLALHVATFPANLRLALTTGFLGGLTTYSSFNYETTHLFTQGAPALALANFVVTAAVCFVAGLAGLALAQGLVGA